MKLISWNVNGFRACIGKGFWDFFKAENADFFCLQETKMQEEQKENYVPENGYHQYWSSAQKKGYSGTLVFAKKPALNVVLGINGQYNDEGRIITLEYEKFYLVTIYTPNSQAELARLDYRLQFEKQLQNYLRELAQKKNVIICGDLNVAHQEIDLKNPKANRRNPGFSDEEREKFSELLATGFTDSFRFLYPEKIKYSWWSYRFNARKNNAGWRIDYFLVNDSLASKIKESVIYNEILGSDHCPVGLELEL